MTELPPYDALRGVDRGVLHGLIHERATAAYEASYEHAWQRDRETWRAVAAACAAAAAGASPSERRAAPPRWFVPLVRRLLAEDARASWSAWFPQLRVAERLGLVALEPDDTYVLAVVSTGPAALADDPELVERVVWRMFEVEGGGEVSLTNHDKFSSPTWQDAFVTMTADGTLPRERVLRSCLRALRRDFSAYRAGWYARTYDALDPSPAEQAAHQDDLRALLRSPIAATVTMAVRRLRALGKAGLLDDAAVVPALAPALVAPVKGTAVEAVRLLDDVARRGSADVSDVATAVAGALDHPNADVQRAAVRVLLRLGRADLAEGAALEPSVAAELGAAPAPPAAVAAAPTATPALPARAVRPVTDDLLDRLAALLEDAGDGFEVEAVVAALAALADPDALRPLRKRATTVVNRGPRDGVTLGWLRGQLARLVLVALREPAGPIAMEPGTELLVARLAEVESVLAGHAPPFRMTAVPDDGWFVRPESLRADAPHHDSVAARLRLRASDSPPVRARVTTYQQTIPSGTFMTWRVERTDGGPLPDRLLWDNEYEDWVGWLAMTAPHDAEHFLVATAPAVLAAADSTMVRHDAVRVLDVLAAHPGRFGSLAYATVAAGLAATKTDQRVRAVDLLLARSLDAAALADAMATVEPVLTPARWAGSLADVAAGGGGAFVLDVLNALLPRLPHDLRGLAALLATYREESLRRNARAPEDVRAWLAGIAGSGKAATTAKAVLAQC